MELRRKLAKSLGCRTEEETSVMVTRNGYAGKSWLMATLVLQRSHLANVGTRYDNEAFV